MERWVRIEDGRADILDNTDALMGHGVVASKMVHLATTAQRDGALLGTDKVIIALLGMAFVLLTEEELNWSVTGADDL